DIEVDTGYLVIYFFQAEDGIRDRNVTGVQTCALPILNRMFWIKFRKNLFFKQTKKVISLMILSQLMQPILKLVIRHHQSKINQNLNLKSVVVNQRQNANNG